MNKFKNCLVLIGLLGIGQRLLSQVDYSDFIVSGEYDSYKKVAVKERIAVPYPAMREANIKYTKHVIRCIDARQKMNKNINWPRSGLNEHLYTALWEGALTPYRNDSLATPYTTNEYRERLSYESFIPISIDPDDPTLTIDSPVRVFVEASTIQKFWVMEEWNFDYEQSVFKPRIIAIAPIYKRPMSIGLAPEQPMCWIKMDQNARDQMSKWELFNRYNDAARLSFDDLFQLRLFDSYIVFENNVFDLMINYFPEYENDQEGALLKADEIKNDLFTFEHDLWQF